MAGKKTISATITIIVLFTISIWGCSDSSDSTTEPGLALNNCTSCHFDADQLVATAEAEEDPGSENPGEG